MRLRDVQILDYDPKDVIIVKVDRVLKNTEKLEIEYYVKSIFKTNEVIVLDRDMDIFPYRNNTYVEPKKLIELKEAAEKNTLLNRFWNFLLS